MLGRVTPTTMHHTKLRILQTEQGKEGRKKPIIMQHTNLEFCKRERKGRKEGRKQIPRGATKAAIIKVCGKSLPRNQRLCGCFLETFFGWVVVVVVVSSLNTQNVLWEYCGGVVVVVVSC
jgi:hypothetical protein